MTTKDRKLSGRGGDKGARRATPAGDRRGAKSAAGNRKGKRLSSHSVKPVPGAGVAGHLSRVQQIENDEDRLSLISASSDEKQSGLPKPAPMPSKSEGLDPGDSAPVWEPLAPPDPALVVRPTDCGVRLTAYDKAEMKNLGGYIHEDNTMPSVRFPISTYIACTNIINRLNARDGEGTWHWADRENVRAHTSHSVKLVWMEPPVDDPDVDYRFFFARKATTSLLTAEGVRLVPDGDRVHVYSKTGVSHTLPADPPADWGCIAVCDYIGLFAIGAEHAFPMVANPRRDIAAIDSNTSAGLTALIARNRELVTVPKLDVYTTLTGYICITEGDMHCMVPQAWISIADKHFCQHPARNPANFHAAVTAVTSAAYARVGGDLVPASPPQIYAAVMVAYTNIDLQYSLMQAAWRSDVLHFNLALTGNLDRRWTWTKLLTIGGVMIGWPIAVAYATSSWYGLIGWAAGAGLLAYFPYARIKAHARIETTFGRSQVWDPLTGGHSVRLLDRLRDACAPIGDLVADAEAWKLTAQVNSRMLEIGDREPGASLTRIGGVFDEHNVVYANTARNLVAACNRFFSHPKETIPHDQALPASIAHNLGVYRAWMNEHNALAGLRFKPEMPRVAAWFAQYIIGRGLTAQARVRSVLEPNTRCRYTKFADVTPDHHELYSWEQFVKMEQGNKRPRPITLCNPNGTVIMGVAENDPRPHAKGLLSGEVGHATPLRRWLYTPGMTRAQLAIYGQIVHSREYRTITYDFSRWDGSIPGVLMRGFYNAHRNGDRDWDLFLDRLPMLRVSLRMGRELLGRYKCFGKGPSGSSWTTYQNTTLHAVVVTAALADAGLVDQFHLGLAHGDDGLMVFRRLPAQSDDDFNAAYDRVVERLEDWGFTMDPIERRGGVHADFLSSWWCRADCHSGFAFLPKCARAMVKRGWALDVDARVAKQRYHGKIRSDLWAHRGCPACEPVLTAFHDELRKAGIAAIVDPRDQEEHKPASDSDARPSVEGEADWLERYGVSHTCLHQDIKLGAFGDFDAGGQTSHLLRIDYGGEFNPVAITERGERRDYVRLALLPDVKQPQNEDTEPEAVNLDEIRIAIPGHEGPVELNHDPPHQANRPPPQAIPWHRRAQRQFWQGLRARAPTVSGAAVVIVLLAVAFSVPKAASAEVREISPEQRHVYRVHSYDEPGLWDVPHRRRAGMRHRVRWRYADKAVPSPPGSRRGRLHHPPERMPPKHKTSKPKKGNKKAVKRDVKREVKKLGKRKNHVPRGPMASMESAMFGKDSKIGGLQWAAGLLNVTKASGVRVPDGSSMIPTSVMTLKDTFSLPTFVPGGTAGSAEAVLVVAPDPYCGRATVSAAAGVIGSWGPSSTWQVYGMAGAGNLGALTSNAYLYRTAGMSVRIAYTSPVGSRGGTTYFSTMYDRAVQGQNPTFPSAAGQAVAMQTFVCDTTALAGEGATISWLPMTSKSSVIPAATSGAAMSASGMAWRTPGAVTGGFVPIADGVLVIDLQTPSSATTGSSYTVTITYNMEFIPVVGSTTTFPGAIVPGGAELVTSSLVNVMKSADGGNTANTINDQVVLPAQQSATAVGADTPTRIDPPHIEGKGAAPVKSGGGIADTLIESIGGFAQDALTKWGPDLLSMFGARKHAIACNAGVPELSPVWEDWKYVHAVHGDGPNASPHPDNDETMEQFVDRVHTTLLHIQAGNRPPMGLGHEMGAVSENRLWHQSIVQQRQRVAPLPMVRTAVEPASPTGTATSAADGVIVDTPRPAQGADAVRMARLRSMGLAAHPT